MFQASRTRLCHSPPHCHCGVSVATDSMGTRERALCQQNFIRRGGPWAGLGHGRRTPALDFAFLCSVSQAQEQNVKKAALWVCVVAFGHVPPRSRHFGKSAWSGLQSRLFKLEAAVTQAPPTSGSGGQCVQQRTAVSQAVTRSPGATSCPPSPIQGECPTQCTVPSR